jgi:hypothetical protein
MATFANRESLRATSPGRPRSHPRDLLAYHEAFEERAAVYEFDGGLPRAEAEMRARRDVRHLLPDFCEVGFPDDVAPSTSPKDASCQWPEAPR